MRLCKAFRQSRGYGNITGLEICGGHVVYPDKAEESIERIVG